MGSRNRWGALTLMVAISFGVLLGSRIRSREIPPYRRVRPWKGHQLAESSFLAGDSTSIRLVLESRPSWLYIMIPSCPSCRHQKESIRTALLNAGKVMATLTVTSSGDVSSLEYWLPTPRLPVALLAPSEEPALNSAPVLACVQSGRLKRVYTGRIAEILREKTRLIASTHSCRA